MGRKKNDVLQGTLDLLILTTLAQEPAHGWGVARRIQEISRDALRINQGSLYPALYRLADRGLVTSELAESAEGRPVKVYSLTPKGRKALQEEARSWESFRSAVDLVLAETSA